MTPVADPAADYFQAIQTFDPYRATNVVLELLDQATPMQNITEEVLAPAQVRVGHLWESGVWSVADEHAATSITEGALATLTHAARRRPDAGARHVAVACVEGEWHSLPARMIAAVTEATGRAKVTILGPSLPAEQLHRRLAAGDIDLVALSCTMPTNLIGAAHCIAAAHDVNVPVIVGGRAFGANPLRARAIGADGWTEDARALLGTIPPMARRELTIPAEALFLNALDEDTLTSAYQRLAQAIPMLRDMPYPQQAGAKEGLRWLGRFSANALLTHDATILEDALLWCARLLQGKMPPEAVTTCAQILAETVASQCSEGAAMLRDSAATVGAKLH